MKLTIAKEIKFSEGEIKVIKTLMETPQYEGGSKGWWEFRDGSHQMCRGGILDGNDCWTLEDKGVVEMDDMAWHTTFNITEFGKEVYDNIKLSEIEE